MSFLFKNELDTRINMCYFYTLLIIKNLQAEGVTVSPKKTGFYDIHRDGLGSHKGRHNVPENELLHGFARKISITLLLTNEFEGGNLVKTKPFSLSKLKG